MIKRIEFSLNLEDPQEAKIYRALQPSLRYRRAGAVIRQALGTFFVIDEAPTGPQTIPHSTIQDTTNEQA